MQDKPWKTTEWYIGIQVKVQVQGTLSYNNNKSLFTITVIKYNSHPSSGSANRGRRVYKDILY